MRKEDGPRAPCGGSSRRARLALLLWVAVTALTVPLPASAQASHAAAEVAFTHGVLAFLEGDVERAAGLLEEAVRNDPDEGTYLHWLGAAYVRLDRGADAAARLEQSLQAKRPPAAGKARVQDELRQVRESLARGAALPQLPEPSAPLELRFPGGPPPWQGEIGVATAYDSNPRLLAEDLAVPSTGVPADVRGDGAALLDLRLDYRPLWDRGGWTLDLTAAGYGTLHQDLDDTDLTVARGTASLAWGRNPGGLVAGPLGGARVPSGRGPAVLLQGGGLYARFGGEELLRSWEAALSVAAFETSRTETRLSAAARTRDYAAAAGLTRRDDEDEVSAGVEEVVFLGRRDRYLRVGVEGGNVRAGRAQAASFGQASAEVALPLSTRSTLYLSGSRRNDRYDHPESNLGHVTGPARDDVTWRVAATGLWRMTERLQWIARGAFIRRDSNVELSPGTPLLDYDRTVLSLGLRWSP